MSNSVTLETEPLVRGDAFSVAGPVTGLEEDLTYTVASTAYDANGSPVADLVCEIGDPAEDGSRALSVECADTSDWPVGRVHFRIRITDQDNVTVTLPPTYIPVVDESDG